MAQTKNLVVTSLETNGDKVFVRIGDSSPLSTSTNSSAILFLQDSEKTFVTSGTQSAFRIRHNSLDSLLVFLVSNRDGDTYSALTINDQGGIDIVGTLTFDLAEFDQISSSLYIGDGSQLDNLSWKTVKKLDTFYLESAEYTIYTTSIYQTIKNYNYLNVFLNDTLLIQSSSDTPNWDYKSNGTDSNSIIFNYDIPVIAGSDFYLTYQYSGGRL